MVAAFLAAGSTLRSLMCDFVPAVIRGSEQDRQEIGYGTSLRSLHPSRDERDDVK